MPSAIAAIAQGIPHPQRVIGLHFFNPPARMRLVEVIRAAVSRRHAVPIADVRLVAAGAIPRTTSGKLARRACRAEYLAGILGHRHPTD